MTVKGKKQFQNIVNRAILKYEEYPAILTPLVSTLHIWQVRD